MFCIGLFYLISLQAKLIPKEKNDGINGSSCLLQF